MRSPEARLVELIPLALPLPIQATFIPCVDGTLLARKISDHARRSVRPCVRPVDAARTPLAFMLSADQIPIKSTRSKALWDRWVCLVPGSTGFA